jgi:hypothetical protein
MSISPNPCNSGEQITLIGSENNAKISITSADGKLVDTSTGINTIRAPKATGLYYMHIINDSKTAMLRLIVQ